MRWCYLICLAVVVLPLAQVRAEEREEDEASDWMKQKLEHSQKIFASLAKEDFDTMAETTSDLGTEMSRTSRELNP